MRMCNIDRWPYANTVRTDNTNAGAGKFCGIAIGPNSDEGYIEVDGYPLQAGRVLPLRTVDGYSIKRMTGVAPINTDDTGTVQNLLAVRRLTLMLFECPEELACEVARANGRYTTRSTNPAGIATGGIGVYSRILTFPAVGRRQAIITTRMVVSDLAHAYRIIGRRYNAAAGVVLEFVLVDTTMTAVGGTPSLARDIVGGNDLAESYDEYAVDVAGIGAQPTAAATCEAETIGEIGVR